VTDEGPIVIDVLALAVVASAGLYFVALGVSAFVSPSRTRRFLLAFAGTPTKHYTELALRMLLGGAFVMSAPRLPLSGPFGLFSAGCSSAPLWRSSLSRGAGIIALRSGRCPKR
jgi:hypothetical protein